MKKKKVVVVIIVAVVFVLALLFLLWNKGHTDRLRRTDFCKGIVGQQMMETKESGEVLPLEAYKEQFVDCMKEFGFPDIFIEQALEENF